MSRRSFACTNRENDCYSSELLHAQAHKGQSETRHWAIIMRKGSHKYRALIGKVPKWPFPLSPRLETIGDHTVFQQKRTHSMTGISQRNGTTYAATVSWGRGGGTGCNNWGNAVRHLIHSFLKASTSIHPSFLNSGLATRRPSKLGLGAKIELSDAGIHRPSFSSSAALWHDFPALSISIRNPHLTLGISL